MYKVLIVDDNKVVRYDLKKLNLWNKYGFEIAEEASDGKEALLKLSDNIFDLALVDIKMPRIDGIEFLKEIREKGNDLCVIIASGFGEFEYARQGIVLGALDYILKPIDEEKLSEVLKRARIFLDEKLLNDKKEAKVKKELEDNLQRPMSKKEEDYLVSLLIENPDESLIYAENMLNKINFFYKNDIFKIGIFVDCICNNINLFFKSSYPWIDILKLTKSITEIKLQDLESIELISKTFLQIVKDYISLSKNLHLHNSDCVIKKMCEYAVKNVDSKITTESASECLGYSSSYLGKFFKQKTGEGFVEFITKVKIERAKVLIHSGKYKNYEICDILGYKTTDYFSSLFKQHTGMTPTEFKSFISKL